MDTPRSLPQHLTSTEAAHLLHVGPSTIKRWASSGELPCEVTPGGHRRFARDVVERFARQRRASRGEESARDPLVAELLFDRPVWSIQASILERRAQSTSWHETADGLARVCATIGECWATGEISIFEEHRASERFTRALAACAETLVLSKDAPRALLAVAEGDEHTLALRLAELALREAGWNVEWAGPRTPTSALTARIERGGLGLVGISASVCSADERSLAAQARQLQAACSRVDAHLVLGGAGVWPAIDGLPGDNVHRVNSFRELHELLVGGLE